MLSRLKVHFAFACICLFPPTGFGQTDEKIEIINDQNPIQVALKYDVAKSKPFAHPDFILPSIDDPTEMIQLSKHRGKKVLLLHFASW